MLAAVTTALCLLGGAAYAQTACYSSPPPEDWLKVQEHHTAIQFDHGDVPTLNKAMKALKKVDKELQDLSKKGLQQAIAFMEETFPPPPSKTNKKKKKKKKKNKKKKKKAPKNKRKNKQSKKQELQSSCPGPGHQCTSVSIPLRCLEYRKSLCFVVRPFGSNCIEYKKCSCVSCAQQDLCSTTGHCVATDYEYVKIVAYCPRLCWPYTFVKLLVAVPQQCQCLTNWVKDAYGPASKTAPVPVGGASNATQEA